MTTHRPAKKSSADLVDEQLAKYRSMRDFNLTREPSGGTEKKAKAKSSRQAKTSETGLPFIIQKHAASHLHYDFRLGWNGVLKSWAVAKGPSYNTKDKRLAVQVEDHPMEYGGFEGVIPKGQYGGGTVMLWDTGTWEPLADQTNVEAGLRDGSLKFTMHGTKIKGKWTLVRMGGKTANASKPNWLLIKEHDSFERGSNDPCITEEAPDSVLTKRSLEEIAHQEDHVWNSKETANGSAWQRQDSKRKKTVDSEKTAGKIKVRADAFVPKLNSYPKEKLPEFIPPQLAIQSDSAIDREGWLHELKLDGYRIQARKDGSTVKLLTRSGLDWTHRMMAVSAEIAKLPVDTALLDGEVVVLAENGTTSFADLQAAFKDGEKHTLTYFIFDLLHVNGRSLRSEPLAERKGLLAQMLSASSLAPELVQLSGHIETDGSQVFQNACKLHAEGIISKRAASSYTSGRSGDWVKVKCIYDQEFVIGGFTPPSNGIHGVGALLLGYYDNDGQLIYAGRTGTGFTQKTHGALRSELEKLRSKSAPFENISSEAKRGVTWVKPTLVAQVRFATWTADNLVRQASFKGLREDKSAQDVRRERAVPVDPHLPDRAASHRSAEVHVAKTLTPAKGKERLAAENTSTRKRQRPVEHASVRLTHPEKILDDESRLTKQQLADYYWQIAKHMLPQIADRPLSLVRCPEGSTQACFFQKHSNAMLPPGIGTVEVPDKKTGKTEQYITLSTRESLAALAQLGVLEVHPWGSRNDDLEHPDRIILDLDPDDSIEWTTLAASADETRKLLSQLGLESFLKSTGGKGLHVVVPLVPQHDWNVIKQFAHAIALELEKRNPALYLTKMSKAQRKGKIFIDYLRNERGSTAVAAFSPRARAGAPVSIPLAWSELKAADRPLFHVGDFAEWKARLSRDPWKKMSGMKQEINLDKIGPILG